MKPMRLVCVITMALTFSPDLQAQDSKKELPMLSAGAGFTYFHGDVGSGNRTGGAFRTGYRIGVEQRLGGWIGLELFGAYGNLTKNERSILFNRNFTTKFTQAGLGINICSDNDLIMSRRASLAPYIGTGFTWMSFDPYGDLKAANDSTYFYWSDGSVRDLPESPSALLTSNFLQRDYTYETRLTDSLNNYPRYGFGIPLTVGTRMKFSRNVGVDIKGTWNIMFTDYIDNVSYDKTDKWLFVSASVYYQFTAKDKSSREKGSSGKDILNEDSDKDGVSDGNDMCPDTPEGVKTDSKGCPYDKDEDGVPDYKDKEPKTPKNTPVDQFGVTRPVTELDSLGNPVNRTADCLPENIRGGDYNHDCVITADEINRAVDEFFDEKGAWTADRINQLIDYYFEQ